MPLDRSIFEIAVVCLLGALMLWAAFTDIRGRIISNRTVLAITGLYPAYALAAGLDPALAGWIGGLLVGFAVLIISAGLFAFNIFGGGDAKMLAAVALWAGPGLLSQFLLITAITGGLLAMGFLVYRRMAPSASERAALDDGAMDSLPYGVAITAGGLLVCWHLLVG